MTIKIISKSRSAYRPIIESPPLELETMRRDAASFQREIELLKGQLKTKDHLIASKDELLNFLRSGFNRPN